MGDTLRSVVEKWHKWAEECRARAEDIKLAGLILTREEALDDCAAELEAMLAEYEKVDLVKRLRAFAGASENADWSDGINRSADELETWLAVNLERIKAQARMEEAKWWWGMYTEGAPAVCDKRIAALEAQAKEKP